MTHHIKLKKEFVEDDVKRIRSSKDILYSTRCNWCTRTGDQFGSLGSDNFVPIKDKSFNGKQAVAIYCASCLSKPERVNDPKSAFILEERGPTEIRLHELDSNDEPDQELKEVLEPKVQESKSSKEDTKDRLLTQKDNIEGEIKTGTSEGTELEPKIEEDKKVGVEKVEEKKKKGIFG